MEKLGIYSIEDTVAMRFDTPVFAVNDIMAERRFVMAIRNDESIFAHFTDEFLLVKIGEFNVTTGKISPMPALLIRKGSEILKQVNKESK